MSSKIDVIPIITRHFDTLRDYATGTRSVIDICLFFGIPLIASGAVVRYKVGLSSDTLTAILASFSIFAGLLLNLLLLVYTRASEEPKTDIFAPNIRRFVRELSDTIEFAVLVSVFVITFSLVAVSTLKRDPGSVPHAGLVMSAVVIYLTTNFLLTLLMILKRIHAMLVERLERASIKKAS